MNPTAVSKLDTTKSSDNKSTLLAFICRHMLGSKLDASQPTLLDEADLKADDEPEAGTEAGAGSNVQAAAKTVPTLVNAAVAEAAAKGEGDNLLALCIRDLLPSKVAASYVPHGHKRVHVFRRRGTKSNGHL